MSQTEIFLHLRVNAMRANRMTWGDTQYAEGLARAIRRRPGCDCTVIYRGERPEPVAGPQVLVQIAGPHLEEPVPGLANLLWMISPPNVAPIAMLQRYQAVFIASDYLTQKLRDAGVQAIFLPQATEASHFHPSRRPPDAKDIPLVFVGGYGARVDRRVVLEAVRAGLEPQIWGPGWDGIIPARLWRGERLDYDALAQTYASARVVLNSHMSNMSQLGFMSNRSYDAMASGARVVSDRVLGFQAPNLPEITQVAIDGLAAQMQDILAAAPADMGARLAMHDRVIAANGFDVPAGVILECARQTLRAGDAAPCAFRRGRSGQAIMPWLTDPATSQAQTQMAMLSAADEILLIASFLEHCPDARPAPPVAGADQGVIHSLMADLRHIQHIALRGASPQDDASLQDITAKARRVAEALRNPSMLLNYRKRAPEQDRLLVNVMHNTPLWAHSPDGFTRDEGKISLPLWGRRHAPAMPQKIGVFLHLYYDDLAQEFAARLAHLSVPSRIYVSTDTDEKAARIREYLPQADIRVLENRGRDIWPKLYGFADVYHRHEFVLHLHGKKSNHSSKLDEWLLHILDCLLGSEPEVNRILSLFSAIPRLGLIAPLTFRGVLGAAHWGANRDIARELAHRMGMTQPLPGNDTLRFPVGSMFWARRAAIQPLLDLRLKPAHFPPEAGQFDGTTAHAIERMLGVTCIANGYHILPVAGQNSRLHLKHQKQLRSNGEVRAALESGFLHA